MQPSSRTDTGALASASEWVLLDGDRLLVAAGLLLGVFVVVSILDSVVGLTSWSSSATLTLLGAFVTGNLTLVTVVLSINQLVLSRELRSPNEMVEEVEAAVDYRDAVEAATGERAAPADFARFLHRLLASMRDEIERLETAAASMPESEIRTSAEALVRELSPRIDEMNELLTQPDVDLFTALSTVLRYDFATAFNHARWLATHRADDLGETATDALYSIQEHVRHFEIARQYVKTVYVQTELATVSRQLLYVGFVSIFASVVVLVLATWPLTGSSLALRITITVGMAPLALILAYVLRVATVAQRTAAFIPFGTPGTQG